MAFEVNSNSLNLYAINSGNYRSNFNTLNIKSIVQNVATTAYDIKINAKPINTFTINSNSCYNINTLTISGYPKEIIQIGLNTGYVNNSTINT